MNYTLTDKILKKTVSKEDLICIANKFVNICETIKDVNDVFELMTEKYLVDIIKNILCEKYGVNPKERHSYKKNIIINKFADFCPKYFKNFDVNTFCANINKIKLPKKTEDIHRIFDFIDFLKYDIINNNILTSNNTIIDNYILYYSNSLDTNLVVHYMILNKNRFLKIGYKNDRTNMKNLFCFNKDYINTESYEIVYIDLYSKKKEQITFDNASKIINIAIEHNYYDMFMDCYNTGIILNETHYSKHLESFVKKYKQYLLKEPYKILEHFCKIEKCQLTMDLPMSNELQKNIPSILHLITNITFDNVKKYYENNYLDVSKYNYTEDQLNTLYNALFVKYVLYKSNHITQFTKDTNIKQYVYREMYKKGSMAQINKFEKLYKLTMDQWCIDNAFIANNKKVISMLMEQKKRPSPNISILLYERLKHPKIKEYLKKHVENIFLNV